MIDPKLREKLKGLEAFINGNILGQPEVVREMVPILINGELGINSQGKPKANLLLLGPPGVGKTEICNAFTEYLLGSDKLVRFDMSEYQTLESIYRLLGHNGEEGLFGLNYDWVEGSGTLLFDEIEKAHERVLVFKRVGYEVEIEVGRLDLRCEIEAQERRGYKITQCDAEALRAIVRNGYSEKQGARRMRNAAREAVQEAVRDALLSGREAVGRLDYNSHSKAFFLDGQK